MFYLDKEGEKENGIEENTAMDESVNADSETVARTMSTTENDSGKQKRRRKAERRKRKKIKFLKYDLVPNSDAAQLQSAVDNEDSNSEGEVLNAHSDEDSDMKV